MSARLIRVLAFLFACSIFLPHARAAVVESSQESTAPSEPSGPKASATVQKILDEANRLAQAQQPLDSLKAADQALEEARQTNDTAGEAFVQQARAEAFHDLQRAKDALAAWHEARQIWARTGDTPEQIVAMTQEALLCAEDNKSEEERLFAEALVVAKKESPRPSRSLRHCTTPGMQLEGKGPCRQRSNTSWRRWP